VRPLVLIGAALVVAFAFVRRRRLSRTNLAFAAVVVAGLLVYGAGLVQPPNVKDAIANLGAALGPYTYALVAVLAFLETGAFVGLVAPGETAIIVGGVIAGQGEIDIVVLIGLTWAAATAGDTASFFLGRRLGRGFIVRHGPRVKITEERLLGVERFFAQHGGKTILIGRFVGVVRAVAPFVAGASRMPYTRFLPYDVLGAGLWATTFCLLGYVFWRSFDRVAEYAAQGAFALGTVIVVVVGSITAYRYFREPENRTAARARMDELEGRRGLGRPVRALRATVDRAVVPGWQRVRRPARFTWNRFTPGDLGLELTTLVAVLAVGTFAFVGLLAQLQHQPFPFGDLRSLDLADDVRSGTLDGVARTLTDLGRFVPVAAVVALAAVVLAVRRHVTDAVVIVVAMGLTAVAVQIAKEAEGRPRPVGGLVPTDSFAFPSGHAAYAIGYVAVAVALARILPLAGRVAFVVVALVVAVAIGATRVYLRVHYLSDVLAGWGMAAAIFALCAVAGLVVTFVRQNRGREP
jgi:undecaprenyl-diphosphatase